MGLFEKKITVFPQLHPGVSHMALIVSPLRSLMLDQVERWTRVGVKCAAILEIILESLLNCCWNEGCGHLNIAPVCETIVVFNMLHFSIKLLLFGMKQLFKHQNLQMFGLKLKKNMSNVDSLEVVCCGSATQLHVDENFNNYNISIEYS